MRNEKNQKRGVKVTLPFPKMAKPDVILGSVESAKANKELRIFEENMKALKANK